MPAPTLRPYQEQGIRALLSAWRGGARRVLMVSPTGSGKTVCFSALTEATRAQTLILTHRRELLEQASRKLAAVGVDHGVIAAGMPARPHARVQVASIPTLIRRDLPPARMVIVDEAHGSTAATWASILDRYPDALVSGWTATPFRLGGKPLVGAWDHLVVVAHPAELREQGHLCPYEGFAYQAPDLSGVKMTGGDYNEGQASALMRIPQLVANVVQMWRAHAAHLSTVCFAASVEHSKALTTEFLSAGARAEHLDGETPTEARRAIIRRVEEGRTQVLVNVGIAVEGLDVPRLKCCILARPTKSVARGLQMMGRVRRPWEGLTARIHDHAFVISRTTGLPDDERDYTLRAKPVPPESLQTCPKCLAVFSGRQCPACGEERPVEERGERKLVTVDDADRVEFHSGDETPAQPRPPVEVRWAAGKVIEGVYLSQSSASTVWGWQQRYRIAGARREYEVPGAADLDRRMRQVQPGARVRLTCTGDRPISGGRVMRTFRVEVDDGAA